MGEYMTNRYRRMDKSLSPHLHIDEEMAEPTGKNDGPHNPLSSLQTLHAYILI